MFIRVAIVDENDCFYFFLVWVHFCFSVPILLMELQKG